MKKPEITNLFKKVKAQRRPVLTNTESYKVLSACGLPIAKYVFVAKKSDLQSSISKLKFPLVMKIISPDIVHKTEAGGVITEIRTLEEANSAYDTIIANAGRYNKKAKIHGILVQETASGQEIIAGSTKDVQFGQTVMFGLGGIFVEIIKDVSFRVVPITKRDAAEMIHELKGYNILKGSRGKKPVNESAIISALLKLSNLLQDYPQIKELDINPLFADEKGVKAADARIILE